MLVSSSLSHTHDLYCRFLERRASRGCMHTAGCRSLLLSGLPSSALSLQKLKKKKKKTQEEKEENKSTSFEARTMCINQSTWFQKHSWMLLPRRHVEPHMSAAWSPTQGSANPTLWFSAAHGEPQCPKHSSPGPIPAQPTPRQASASWKRAALLPPFSEGKAREPEVSRQEVHLSPAFGL